MRVPTQPVVPDRQKIKTQLDELTAVARSLNEVSDELTMHVSDIEEAINKLNLGISANVVFSNVASEDGMTSDYWRLAYGKEAGEWGLIIEFGHEDLNWPENDSVKGWLFRDAPRDRRLQAIERIPELMAALLKSAQKYTSDVSQKLEYARNLAATFAPAPKAEGKK